MTRKRRIVPPPEPAKAPKAHAAWWIAKFAGGQAAGWVRRFLGLFYAAMAGTMLAISWVPFASTFSSWHASLVATQAADAEVIGHRFVCERGWAALLESPNTPVLRGEAGCQMRSEALLRFTDASGGSHEVAAQDPYGLLYFQGLTPGTEANPFQRLVPLVNPEFLAEADSIPKLDAVKTQGPPSYDYAAAAAGKQPLWSQRQALALRTDDPLLFEALAWLGAPPETRVHLRYDPGDPEHAWLAGLLDQPGSIRIPRGAAVVLVPVAVWILWHVIGMYTLDHRWRREIGIALTALAVLATPLWAPRYFDVVEWFSEDGAAVAVLRQDFSEIGQRTDLRTEPAVATELVPLANDSDAHGAQVLLLAGLMPARPARTFATLGEAYAALCEAAGARLVLLAPFDRALRYQQLSTLVNDGANGPAACLMPVALEEARAKHAAGQALDASLKNLMVSVSLEHPIGSSFANDYERDRKWRAQATEIVSADGRLEPARE